MRSDSCFFFAHTLIYYNQITLGGWPRNKTFSNQVSRLMSPGPQTWLVFQNIKGFILTISQDYLVNERAFITTVLKEVWDYGLLHLLDLSHFIEIMVNIYHIWFYHQLPHTGRSNSFWMHVKDTQIWSAPLWWLSIYSMKLTVNMNLVELLISISWLSWGGTDS